MYLSTMPTNISKSDYNFSDSMPNGSKQGISRAAY
jgi:hypothetical protein